MFIGELFNDCFNFFSISHSIYERGWTTGHQNFRIVSDRRFGFGSLRMVMFVRGFLY